MAEKIRLDVGDIIKPLNPSGVVASWRSRRNTFMTYLVFSTDGWRAVTDQKFDPDKSDMRYVICFIMPKSGIDSVFPDDVNCRIEIRSVGPAYVNGLFFYDNEDDDDEKEYIIRTWIMR